MTLVKKNSEKDPKFEVGDLIKISKYKHIFATGYVLNWSEEVFVITKFQSNVPWSYELLLMIKKYEKNGAKIVGK